MPQRLAGMDEGMNNFCKQLAESFHGFIVVIHIKRGQWHLSCKRSQSGCLAKVSVTKQILHKFPEILGELSMCKQFVPGSFFSAHTQEPGNEARE